MINMELQVVFAPLCMCIYMFVSLFSDIVRSIQVFNCTAMPLLLHVVPCKIEAFIIHLDELLFSLLI